MSNLAKFHHQIPISTMNHGGDFYNHGLSSHKLAVQIAMVVLLSIT